jgi:hypothetical protein
VLSGLQDLETRRIHAKRASVHRVHTGRVHQPTASMPTPLLRPPPTVFKKCLADRPRLDAGVATLQTRLTRDTEQLSKVNAERAALELELAAEKAALAASEEALSRQDAALALASERARALDVTVEQAETKAAQAAAERVAQSTRSKAAAADLLAARREREASASRAEAAVDGRAAATLAKAEAELLAVQAAARNAVMEAEVLGDEVFKAEVKVGEVAKAAAEAAEGLAASRAALTSLHLERDGRKSLPALLTDVAANRAETAALKARTAVADKKGVLGAAAVAGHRTIIVRAVAGSHSSAVAALHSAASALPSSTLDATTVDALRAAFAPLRAALQPDAVADDISAQLASLGDAAESWAAAADDFASRTDAAAGIIATQALAAALLTTSDVSRDDTMEDPATTPHARGEGEASQTCEEEALAASVQAICAHLAAVIPGSMDKAAALAARGAEQALLDSATEREGSEQRRAAEAKAALAVAEEAVKRAREGRKVLAKAVSDVLPIQEKAAAKRLADIRAQAEAAVAEAKAGMAAKPSAETKTVAAVMAAREAARLAAAAAAAQSPKRPAAPTSMPAQTVARGMDPKAARMSTSITPDGSEDEGEGMRLGALAHRVVPTPATGLGRKAMPPPAKPTGSAAPARKSVAVQDDALSVTSTGTSVFGDVGKSWQAASGGRRIRMRVDEEEAVEERVSRGRTMSSARAAPPAAPGAPRPALPTSARASSAAPPRTGTPRPPFLFPPGKPSVGKSMFNTGFEAPRGGLTPVARPASAAPKAALAPLPQARAPSGLTARPASSGARPKDMFSDEL